MCSTLDEGFLTLLFRDVVLINRVHRLSEKKLNGLTLYSVTTDIMFNPGLRLLSVQSLACSPHVCTSYL